MEEYEYVPLEREKKDKSDVVPTTKIQNSKYERHQGAKECKRRRKQLKEE